MPLHVRRLWSPLWRYLLAAAAGSLAWVVAAADLMLTPMTPAQTDVAGAVLSLDAVVGVAVLALVPLRRRFPLAVACGTVAASAVSVSSIGAAAVAVVSMAHRRRRDQVVATAVVAVVAVLVFAVLYRPWFSPSGVSVASTVGIVVCATVFVAAAVATGFYLGARRELLVSLHERVLTAEREQALAATAARVAERTLIAREMHDVLAHRISLVALHAGALAYREDLTRTQTAETAQTIQANAQLALAELRQVLGVLRSGPVPDGVQRPQPTLAELPALLADADEAGSVVRLDRSGLRGDPAELTELLSRTSLRIVQEALTNARRHAPGQPVEVRLSGDVGAGMHLEISNPAGAGAGTGGAGVGLVGLAERAELAGGTLTYGLRPDGRFTVEARLPWPAP
jgi:signal transduction histidine kinase